jgi:hypothetical protein
MHQACAGSNLVYLGGMSKLFLMIVLAAALLLGAVGCKTHSGSQEFTPGKGWQQN